IVSPRSTSPPKSAWPGVSTMLIFVPPSWIAVFLARIVIPFSRSRSVESSTRSATSWFSRNEPDCQSIASTRVVFPWSTCAMIATFRGSWRFEGSDVVMVGQGSVGATAETEGGTRGRLHDREHAGCRESREGGRRYDRRPLRAQHARDGACGRQPHALRAERP